MIALSVSLLLYGAFSSAVAEDGYSYLDCSAETTYSGGPGCFHLHFERDLKGFMIEDNGEAAQALEPNVQKEFFIFITSQIPIAIPRKGYEKKDSWNYKEIFVFSKVVRHFTAEILGVRIAADIIEVRDNRKNHVLTFWYSPDKGVQAIMLGSKPYYCSKSPCLFEARASPAA